MINPDLYNSLPEEFNETRPTISASDMESMKEEAERLINEAADKPSAQSYFVRKDTGRVIKTETEYYWCQNNNIPLKIVPYAQAVSLLKAEDGEKKHRDRVKKQKKMAKKARRRNRS